MRKLLTLVVIGLTTHLFGQNVDFKSANFKDDKEGLKNATTAIDKGDEFYKVGVASVFAVQDFGTNFKSALVQFEIAQKFNSNNALLNYKIGVCHANSTNPVTCIEYFKKAYKLDPDCDPFLDYYMGYATQLEGKYDEANKFYSTFESEYKKADDFMKFVNLRRKQCVTAKKFEASAVRCWVDNVPSLSTEQDDIAPSISTDGSEMILSSNRPNSHEPNALGIYDYDIYSSSLLDNGWSTPTKLVGPINSNNDDISNCLSYDGTKMLLHRESGGQTDIFESKLKGLEWSDPQRLSIFISSDKNNEKYASYNEDGWKIYFSRDNSLRETGSEVMFSGMQNKMKQDFMIATMLTGVNSKFNDGPIYIHIDGESMYIASEGHEGMGGYDIFLSKKVQGQWTTPVNLGYPINTPYDDFFFASTANGKFAYISSNRAGGKGGYDIYKVTFWGPEKKPILETEDYLLASIVMPVKDHNIEKSVEVKKKSLTVFKGVTIDAISRKPVEAQIEITDNATGKVIETFTTNSATGKFIITLNSGKNYGIAVKATGYLFHSENFDIPTGADDNLVNKVIELKNIAIGSKIALRNIFFDVNKATLRPESNAEMERLVQLMKDVPRLKIEISGHTDNTGSATLNETLSQQRAEAVVAYLVSKGIAANRMIAKGYGSSQPIASNNSEDGKQQNRRTEFEIKGN
ncbi:OmpA family protein [Fluviicola taffensis]|uniref:OmpA/MotB domain protein n=1 Tax=Fluviicola taffensis (strain DSM 16823 / NCIMB 13979 / RW262) TaxID=755732 RepID=F2IIG3_FLUTR|nr:OmpA family protein [Fluviicola taffensis]AEA44889.1 OmpA/MotB domain protein [Fluviicola taffensis DSM 16823]